MKYRKKMNLKTNFLVLVTLPVILTAFAGNAEEREKKIKRLVFEATTIEGQMGTVKALIVTSDKRPEFSPMALQLAQRNLKLKNVNSNILDGGWYSDVFTVKLPK